ncbi:MAG: ABC transporter [Gammaproteobacteria bacterium]|nr:MAG: ABC transporter [Gammaproteobacteria bacterium]
MQNLTSILRRYRRLLEPLAVVAIMAALAWLSLQYRHHADWTRGGRHSLSAASLMLVKDLAEPLDVTVYAREQTALREAIKRFIARYQRAGADIRVHFIDPDSVPDEIRALGLRVNGEMVLHYQGRSEHVTSGDEETFSNALQRLLRGADRWLAFVAGHGERNPGGRANHDLGDWVGQLTSRGYKFQALNLAAAGVIPDNTAVLIISNPAVDLLPAETNLILDYLERGGNLLWLGDPGDLHGLDSVAQRLGIVFREGQAIDAGARRFGVDDPGIAVLTEEDYTDHDLLKEFDFSTVFPRATSIAAGEKSQGWSLKPLLRTGNESWQEAGPIAGTIQIDDTEARGPLDLAVALERDTGTPDAAGNQRVIVIGDGDFLSNTYLANSGNLELSLRFINWLSRDDALIKLPAAARPDHDFEAGSVASGILGLGFLIVLPAGLLIAGAVIHWRRRRL